MSDIRFTPTTYQPTNSYESPIRIDRPEYEDVGDGWFVCGWCLVAVREIDTPGHTGWHRALTNALWEARGSSS